MATEQHGMQPMDLSPGQMMVEAEKYAQGKVSKSPRTSFLLAITAGIFIGLAFIFYITATTDNAAAGWGQNRMVGGLAFSMGLIMVVICGGELFTSTVLSSVARANGETSTSQMLRTWGRVYAGNFVGAMALVGLVSVAALYQLDHGQWGLSALKIAQHKLHHTPAQAFALGILCNLLVCLAVWMTFSTKQVLTKVALMLLPVAMFVSTGFEHCVANMFMVPLGIAIHGMAGAEFWQQVGVPAAQFADLTWSHFLTANLVPVTLGNIVGGAVLVGLGQWAIYRQPQQDQTTDTVGKVSPKVQRPASATLSTIEAKQATEHQMALQSQVISQFMKAPVLTLDANMSAEAAATALRQHGLLWAPVVADNGELLGQFTAQDLLVELWCQDYQLNADLKVADLMREDVQTVSPQDSMLALAEYMSIDKQALRPVSDQGFAISMDARGLKARAKAMKVDRPTSFPVVENDHLVGMIDQLDVMAALANLSAESAQVEPKQHQVA